MSIQIYTNGNIDIDNQSTGLSVYQERTGTTVVVVDTGRKIELPINRYALSCDKPASGAAGRADFERDLRAVLAQEK